MESVKREILECNNLTMVGFLGKEKIILECPYCGSLISYDSVVKESLGHFLDDELDVEHYLCSCANCIKDYYLYL